MGLGVLALGTVVTGACAPQQAETPKDAVPVVRLTGPETVQEASKVRELSDILGRSIDALEKGKTLPEGIKSAKLGNGRTLASGEQFGTEATTDDGIRVQAAPTPLEVTKQLSGSGEVLYTVVISNPSDTEPVTQEGKAYNTASRYTLEGHGDVYTSGKNLLTEVPVEE